MLSAWGVALQIRHRPFPYWAKSLAKALPGDGAGLVRCRLGRAQMVGVQIVVGACLGRLRVLALPQRPCAPGRVRLPAVGTALPALLLKFCQQAFIAVDKVRGLLLACLCRGLADAPAVRVVAVDCNGLALLVYFGQPLAAVVPVGARLALVPLLRDVAACAVVVGDLVLFMPPLGEAVAAGVFPRPALVAAVGAVVYPVVVVLLPGQAQPLQGLPGLGAGEPVEVVVAALGGFYARPPRLFFPSV